MIVRVAADQNLPLCKITKERDEKNKTKPTWVNNLRPVAYRTITDGMLHSSDNSKTIVQLHDNCLYVQWLLVDADK